MKIIFLFIMAFLLSLTASAQEKGKYALDFGDVFVLKIEVRKDVLSGKSPCNKKNKSILSEVTITDIVYCPTNASFDSTQLLSIKYILFTQAGRSMLNTDSTFLITAKPSGSKYYLSWSRVLKIDNEKSYQFYHPYAYLSALNPCKKKDAFEKYILKQPPGAL